MKWSDYDFPERFQDRAASLGRRVDQWNNSNGGGDLTERVEVELASHPGQSFEITVEVQEAPHLGVTVLWAEAGFAGDPPRLGVRPFAVADAEDGYMWRQRLGNYLVEEARRL